MSNPLFIRPKLTFAGKAAAVEAKDSGVGLDLTHVQFGSAHYATSGAETELREPISGRISFAAGDRPAEGQLRLSAIWTENVGYQSVREIIFWAGDVAAYIWSTEEGDIAATKTDGIPYVLFVDIGLNSEAESVVEIVVDPAQSIAIAALLAHELAFDAHPQYIRRDILPSELRMGRGEAVESDDPDNVRIELPEEIELPHYAPGQRFTWKAVHTNTGPMTMDVDGLGAMPLQKAGTRDLEPADIEAGCMYDFYVDDDMQHFQLAVGVSNHGHADSASRLRTPRKVGGVEFNGTADIDLPGVNKPGNQDTTGNAGSATKLRTPFQINGKPCDGTEDITVERAPTPAEGDDSDRIATTEFVRLALAALVDSSPESLDTLNELAAALGNDPNFATTVTNEIGKKLDKTATAAAATKLATARTINGVAFDGSANITISAAATAASVLSANAAAAIGGVGTYAFMRSSATVVEPGATVAGSTLQYSNPVGTGSSNAVTGTWRCMGRVAGDSPRTLFLRIS